MRLSLRLLIGCGSCTLFACATSSEVLTGAPRSPLALTEVKVYTQAPPNFQEIAVLSASRKSVSSAGGERAIAKMIEAMRSQAAALGANGLLLENFADSGPFAIGTGVSSQTYTHNSSINLGVGGSIGIVKKMAEGKAIFVAPSSRGIGRGN